MSTPRVIAEFIDNNYNNLSIVWVDLGKYEVWVNKQRTEELTHDGVIKYLVEKLKVTTAP